MTENQTELSGRHHEEVGLLFQYYQVLKQDLVLHANGFKNHVRNSQIAITALLSILTLMTGSESFPITSRNELLWVGVMFAVTTMSYYLTYDVLEAVFAMRALEEFLSFLEDRMNKMLGESKLIWQSGIAERLWPTTRKKLGFTPPMRGVEVYGGLLVGGATMLLPGYVYFQVWCLHDTPIFTRILIVGLSIYSVGSAVFIFYTSRAVNDRVRVKVRLMIGERFGKAVR
jgi:hypothetical protein